ncbi:hypothetical protein TREMEDRAFT_58392 [Tremella mesenterica DSM 1558]|uniref:uncharacterized protein n=1 Tax=Tremella mesenterica (strain ATCC 24925 / CBS 8224 / DSM 1558 / NBRC 9311 / NRRL Y-6157 / RJB 2259-6 / UBC 559-6) TaxID=578456 RepID=UPI0003F49430|nr:uncharacterized protein TREMEDRAFT_58392 [Tremella mesenterica DSM 1558]EIW72232.1 hypothetical protein TREMEDRAFT_58392 [Tremella mesenterica DSM 1558]
MPRVRPATLGAVRPSEGKKINFDDDEDDYVPLVRSARRDEVGVVEAADGDWDEDGDEDEAPETVTVGASRVARLEAEARERESAQKRRQAARARSEKIAEMKSKKSLKRGTQAKSRQTKRPRSPSSDEEEVEEEGDSEGEGEDDATRRLRRRMEAAMADGANEDIDDDEDGEGRTENDDDEDEDEDEGDLEDGDSDGEDDDDDDDYSETLEEPTTDAERQLHERMQAAMEAAEARAGLSVQKGPAPSSSKTPKSALKTTTASNTQLESEQVEETFDLTPYHPTAKPLPQSVIEAAARAHAIKAATEAQKKVVHVDMVKKKKRRIEPETIKVISENKTLFLLPPTLGRQDDIPPVIGPGQTGRGANARKAFVRAAMSQSGRVPQKGLVDGRRKVRVGPTR